MQSDGYGYGIEAIEFGGDVGNLVTWTLDDILANTTVTGTAGNETLTGTAYADNLHGLAGNDTLNGSTGEDTLVGGEGNDALDGGVGSDRYVWSKGDGNDNINDSHNSQTEIDTLVLSDVSSDDVSLTRLNGTNHLMIEIISTGETIQITNRYYSYYTTTYGYGIEAIEFGGDGVTWTLDDILAAATFTGTSGNETLTGSSRRDNMFGLEGNDTLNGGGGDDVITGGLGVDALDGGYGSDRYEWSKGDGNDALYDSINSLTDVDTLALLDVTSDDVRLTRANGSNHLMIEIISTGETIQITNRYYGDGYGIEKLEFGGDNVTWTLDDILANTTVTGTSNNETLSGKNMVDNMYGLEGNDTLYGYAGDDTLVGGTGDDYTDGGVGSDRYVWSKGDGNDQLYDTSTSVAEVDTLVLTDVTSDDVRLTRTNGTNHLMIEIISTGETIQVTNRYYSQGYGIEAIEFKGDNVTWTLDDILANTTVTGTAGNETLTGTAYADNLHGLAGNDTLNGSTGEDTLVGGEGNDALDGGVGSDRYVWSKGDGNDNINDSHNSQTEIDTLVLSDVSSDDVSLTRLNGTNHLMIEIISTGETIQITNRYYSYYTTTYGYGIEAIEFGGDGVTWTLDDILAAATFTGTSGNETLIGSSRRDNMFGLEGNDTLNGGGGDDVITGGLGVDALDGGYGSDRYEWSKGDGNDALYDSINSLTDVDTLALLDVTSDDVRLTRANGSNHLMIEIISTGEEITIHNQFSASGHNRALEQLEFADGSVLDLTDTTSLKRVITGSSGDNELHGKALDDVLLGKAGNDNLVGDSGADFLSGGTGEDQLNGGSGSDILIGGSGADTLVGGTGLGGFTKAQSNGNGSTNNGLVKTSGGTGWNGGAYSKESFTGAGSGAGSVTTTVAKTGHHVMVGLSDQAEDASTKNIDYALYQYVNGTLHIYESGVSKGQFGAYAIGDELTVERLEDGTVQYLKNGIVLYTSAKISSPHVALSADASMYEEGSRIGQTKLAVNGAEQNVEWVVENHVENDTLGTDLKTDYVDVDGDGNVDIVLSNDVGEVWTRTGSGDGTFNDVVGQGIGSGSNVLTKVSGGAAWNGGAHSVESFIGAGKVTSTPLTSTTQAHVGLSAASTLSAEGSYATIDYSLGMWSDSQIRIFENGVFRGIFSTYTEGDTVSVERLDNGTVQYLKNDVVIYTSTIASPTDIELGVDTSLYGGKLGDTTLQVGTNNAELVNWVVENHVANDTLGANLKADYVDINGDGNVDIVLSSDVGEVWTRTGNGDGTFDDVVEHGDGSTSNTLTKTSGGTGWNGGAYSKQSFTGSGATSTTSVSTGHHVMTGLSNSPEDAGYGSIDFAWYQTPGGVLYIYESGASRGQFGTYAVGDELTVERLNDGTVQYLQNGNLIYTSTVNSPTSEALSADSSIHWQGNQIGNTTLQVGSNAAELVDWAVNGHITVDPIDTDLQTDYVDVDGDGNVDIVLSNDVGEVWTRTGSGDGTFNDAVEHGDGSISEPGTQENPLNVSYVDMDGDGNVDIALSNTNGKVWTRTGNGDGSFGEAIAQGAGSNSKELVKTAGGSAWNGGAYSNKSFTGAGTFSTVVVSTGHYVVVGLSEAAQDGGYNNMNFALYQNPGGNLYIYESGVSKGIFGTYKVGDVLSIKRLDDGTVQYLKNDTVIHTSDTVSQLDVELTVDASLYYQDSRLGDTTLQIGNGDPELVDWITNAYVEVGSFGSNLQTNFVDVDGDNRVDTLMSSELGENWIRYGKDDVDTFRFTDIDDSTQTNADTIVDFDIEYDLLDLSELDVSFDDIEITEESGMTEVSITDTDFMIRLTGTGLGLAEDQFLF